MIKYISQNTAIIHLREIVDKWLCQENAYLTNKSLARSRNAYIHLNMSKMIFDE